MIAALIALAAIATASPAGDHRRIALFVGNNQGRALDEDLKYAEDDAREIAAVLEQVGGVASSRMLLGGSAEDLDRAFDELAIAIAADGRPTTLFFFYSGHADGTALSMNGSRYPFDHLKRRLEASAARLFVAFIDACESGKIIRPKGGRPIPVVDLDLSHLDRSLEGGVMLASTSAGELAQESDELGGSFFSHYLASGLRGGADVSGDRRVSLEELYQFVYHHTLDRTRSSRLGPQHPTYGLNVDGRGELVLTWMNEGGSALILTASAEGTYFVRDTRRARIVAEVDKRAGTELRVAVTPGRYEVSRRDGIHIWTSELEVAEQTEHRFDESMMRSSPLAARQGKASGSQIEAGVAYVIGGGYLDDAGLRHGVDLFGVRRTGPLELGLLAAVSTSGYRRSDQLQVRLWEVGVGAFVQSDVELAADVRASLGLEARWLWAHQDASRGQSREGGVVPLAALLGLLIPIGEGSLTAGFSIGPVLYDGPAGLEARWIAAARIGARVGF